MILSDVNIRPIVEHDLPNGFLDSLDALRPTSDIDVNKARDILSRIISNPNHMIFVADYNGQVVGSITLLIEPKFIHGGSQIGHIEDVVVRNTMQGSGLGRMLVDYALKYSKGSGCYKTILDCADDLVPFYQKCGFQRHANNMRYDHD